MFSGTLDTRPSAGEGGARIGGRKLCGERVMSMVLPAGSWRLSSDAGQTNQTQSAVLTVSAKAKRGGDIDGSGQTQQADGQVAQRGHDLSSGLLANAAAVFVKAHVAHIMQAIFNAPVAAIQRQQAPRVGVLRIQAGEAMHGFPAKFARDQIRSFALDDENLSYVGKIQIVVQFRAGPDAPDF